MLPFKLIGSVSRTKSIVLNMGEQIIVPCKTIARQRLGKHIPVNRMHATEEPPLLGNGPLNTLP
jgi:hypothetical protein